MPGSFDEVLDRRQREAASSEAHALVDALEEALARIMSSPDLGGDQLAEAMTTSVDQFVEEMTTRLPEWTQGTDVDPSLDPTNVSKRGGTLTYNLSPQEQAAVLMAKAAERNPESREALQQAAQKPIESFEATDHLTEMAKASPALAKLKPHVEQVMSRDGVEFEVALGKVAGDPARYADVQAYMREQRG